MKLLKLAFVCLLLSAACFAQNTFSLTLTPISLPGNNQTVAGTNTGATLAVTQKIELRTDAIFAPGQDFQYFGGGFNYHLPILKTKLNNASPNLDGFRFGFYLTGSVGVDRLTAVDKQHYAYLAGGGINYDLTGSGTWTFGGEVRYARFPGLKNNAVVVSVGPSIHF